MTARTTAKTRRDLSAEVAFPDPGVESADLARVGRQLTAWMPDRATLPTRLASIRERGYAISKGEINAEAVGVAAPVFRRSQCVCVISGAGGAVTLAGDRLREALRVVTSAAADLGGALDRTTVDTAWSRSSVD